MSGIFEGIEVGTGIIGFVRGFTAAGETVDVVNNTLSRKDVLLLETSVGTFLIIASVVFDLQRLAPQSATQIKEIKIIADSTFGNKFLMLDS